MAYKRGIALILSYFLGILGADKFYLGLIGQGVGMLVLTLSIIGILGSGIWSLLCTISLAMAISYKNKPFMYPSNIEWDPVDDTDNTMLWVILGFMILEIVLTIIKSSITPRVLVYDHIKTRILKKK